MKSKKGIAVLSIFIVAACVAASWLFAYFLRKDVENEQKTSESGEVSTSQAFVINSETELISSSFEDENAYGFELFSKNEDGVTKYGVRGNSQTVIPCKSDKISFLSKNRILAQKGTSDGIKSSESVLIYDGDGNIICDEGNFSYVVFEKREGAFEETGIGAYNKNGDLRQAEYWVIDQNGNKLSEVYTFIERVYSTIPEVYYYAVRIDKDTLYMSSYRLKINGEVLEEVVHSHPDGVEDTSVVEGKSGNYIYLYARGTYITGYNNKIGGYDYVAFEVENVDEWQIGDEVDITHTGKIKYSDPPVGELIKAVKKRES